MIWPYLLGITTTIVGAYIVYFLAHSRWWKEYRLQKLEELYTAVENHQVAIAEYYTRGAVYLMQPEDEDAKELEKQREILRTNYMKALQEDEKKAAVILMLINFYFKDLLPMWQTFKCATRELGKEYQKAIMLDKAKREALGREKREAICKSVGLTIIKKHLPGLETLKNEMCTETVQIVDHIGGAKPWPFKARL
jgi:hypothetical protein